MPSPVPASLQSEPLIAELEEYRRQFLAIKEDAHELPGDLHSEQFIGRLHQANGLNLARVKFLHRQPGC